MSKLTNTIRLARHLRKGKHEKFAIQKTLARIGTIEGSAEHRLSYENDLVGRQEPHREIDINQTHLQDTRLRDKGEV